MRQVSAEPDPDESPGLLRGNCRTPSLHRPLAELAGKSAGPMRFCSPMGSAGRGILDPLLDGFGAPVPVAATHSNIPDVIRASLSHIAPRLAPAQAAKRSNPLALTPFSSCLAGPMSREPGFHPPSRPLVERKKRSCTECRRRKQKVCFESYIPVSIEYLVWRTDCAAAAVRQAATLSELLSPDAPAPLSLRRQPVRPACLARRPGLSSCFSRTKKICAY